MIIAIHEGNASRYILYAGVTVILICFVLFVNEDRRFFRQDAFRIQPNMNASSSFFYFRTKNKTIHEFNANSTFLIFSAIQQEKRIMDISIIPPYFELDYNYCSSSNDVLDRGDNYGTSHEKKRPYSITNYTFATFHNHNVCSNLSETLHAIKYGTRKWINESISNLTSLEREEFQSYFVPDQCDIPYLSAHDACSIMGHYSHVLTVGDSLTRHLRQALLITLRRDLILGGIETLNKHREDNPFDCRCDGQFSEHAHCRQNDNLFNVMTPRDLNLCSKLPDQDQFYFNDEINWPSINCSQPETKGVLLLLQGGLHFNMNADQTMIHFVLPSIQHPNFHHCANVNKLRVIWIAFSSQSRSVDQKYPTQSRENALLFNQQMNQKIQEAIPNITIIDWWNLTLDAQTSDGVHFLTDVNLQKANHFLHVVKLLT
jgi:hypothetical protein